MLVTLFAVLLKMVGGMHMNVGNALRTKLHGASSAWESLCPVFQSIHVLLDCMHGAKPLSASLTFVWRRPMVFAVHVLLARAESFEIAGARLTLVHSQVEEDSSKSGFAKDSWDIEYISGK